MRVGCCLAAGVLLWVRSERGGQSRMTAPCSAASALAYPHAILVTKGGGGSRNSRKTHAMTRAATGNPSGRQTAGGGRRMSGCLGAITGLVPLSRYGRAVKRNRS